MATHSSIHAWEIPWTEEPGGLQSTGSQSRTWRAYTEDQRHDRYRGQCGASRGEVLKSTQCFCILSDTGSEWVHRHLFLLLISSMYVRYFFLCMLELFHKLQNWTVWSHWAHIHTQQLSGCCRNSACVHWCRIEMQRESFGWNSKQ